MEDAMLTFKDNNLCKFMTEQEMREKASPYLPLDRVLVRPDEGRQRERLLELLGVRQFA